MREKPMWRRYLRFLGSDPAADVDDELAFHFATRVDDLMRSGLTESEARARAQQEFGDVDRIRGELKHLGRRRQQRENRAIGWDALRQDVRFALRTLRKNPGFTAAASITLAIGIGAGTAMFSVLDGVLLRELPVRQQDEVVVMWAEAPAREADHLPVLHRDLAGFREATRTFQSVAGVAYQGATEQVVVDAGSPLTVRATWVTGDFFRVLGVVPVHGRTLLPQDDVPGAERVVVISHGFWQRYYGGASSVIGRGLQWNGQQHTVVGVLPRGFEYPQGAEVWTPVLPAFPATLEAQASPAEIMVFDLVGRLLPGATVSQARADFGAFLRAGDAERPEALRGTSPVVTPLPELITGDARASLWAAAAAVALLLLIACVNVANLLLIRGAARGQELAIRSALGAGRSRLIRQLLTESGLLAAVGGALGVLVALAAVRWLVFLAPAELPRREMIGIDARVLLFALLVTGAAALLAGLLPSVLAAAGDLSAWLRGGRRSSGGSRATQALRHALVIGQVSLAIIVVVAAGLLVRSLVNLQTLNLGFNQERLVVLQTTFPPELLPERSQQVTLQEAMLEQIGAIPGVVGVASLPRPPFSAQGGWTAMYTGEGQAHDVQATNPWVNFEVVGPGYFRTLEIPLQRGRAFGEQDREDAAPVAVVSEAVARHTWPDEDPIGKQIKLGPPDGRGQWHTVVGVAGETRYRELTSPQPTLYLPIRQFGGPVPMSVAVRTSADPAGLIPQVRLALQQLHPQLLLVSGGTMRQLLAEPLARPRFSTVLLGAFAVITLLLASIGIYGVMAASVRQRTREIGIRIAVGATVNQVRRLVLRQGVQLAFWGCVLGVAGAFVAVRALSGMLFGVQPTDPATFGVVVALILATAVLACYLPALRASRVDPVETLRTE